MFELARAPLLFTKAFKHLCFVCSPSCALIRVVTKERFGLAHAPLLFTKTFKYLPFVCSSSSCVLARLVTTRAGLAHAPLPSTKAFGHSGLRVSLLLVRLLVVFVLLRHYTSCTRVITPKSRQAPKVDEPQSSISPNVDQPQSLT